MSVIENKWELYIDGIGGHQRVLGFDRVGTVVSHSINLVRV